MEIVIKGRNLEVTEWLRVYIEKKVNRLDRFLPNIDEARMELAVQKTKSAGDRHVVQFTVRSKNTLLRAEERSSDMQTAIDTVLEKMQGQVERWKGKHWRALQRASVQPGESTEVEVEAEEAATTDEGQVVRIKTFQTRPMAVDEAIEQMELLGHDFFVFFNADSNAFSVVYRRRDGGYGLLLPEMA